MAIFTSVIVVNPGLPVKNMQELVAYGKANEMSLATGNASGVVMSETLARQVGWKLLRVPFKSNPQAMTEVVAGRVQSMFTDIAAASAQIKAGTLRPIVVTSKQRSALMPELPTIAETAAPDYDLSGWIALFAPAGTPRPIVDRLNAEVTKALNSAEVRQKLLDLGAEPSPMPVADFSIWVQQEVNKWDEARRKRVSSPNSASALGIARLAPFLERFRRFLGIGVRRDDGRRVGLDVVAVVQVHRLGEVDDLLHEANACGTLRADVVGDLEGGIEHLVSRARPCGWPPGARGTPR